MLHVGIDGTSDQGTVKWFPILMIPQTKPLRYESNSFTFSGDHIYVINGLQARGIGTLKFDLKGKFIEKYSGVQVSQDIIVGGQAG